MGLFRPPLYLCAKAMNSLGIMIGQEVKVVVGEQREKEVRVTKKRGQVFAWSKDGERYLVRIDKFGWAWFKTDELIVKRSMTYVTVNMN